MQALRCQSSRGSAVLSSPTDINWLGSDTWLSDVCHLFSAQASRCRRSRCGVAPSSPGSRASPTPAFRWQSEAGNGKGSSCVEGWDPLRDQSHRLLCRGTAHWQALPQHLPGSVVAQPHIVVAASLHSTPYAAAPLAPGRGIGFWRTRSRRCEPDLPHGWRTMRVRPNPAGGGGPCGP